MKKKKITLSQLNRWAEDNPFKFMMSLIGICAIFVIALISYLQSDFYQKSENESNGHSAKSKNTKAHFVKLDQTNCSQVTGVMPDAIHLVAKELKTGLDRLKFLGTEFNPRFQYCLTVWSHSYGVSKCGLDYGLVYDDKLYATDLIIDNENDSAIHIASVSCDH